jgi:pimeloyl-ACP methyl ester carboxylesterase
MPQIPLAGGISLHCAIDDFLWPWDTTTPVLMMHGFARNALFWNRWVPGVAETRRVYRPDLLGCGLSDRPPAGYRYTPETIGAQITAVLDKLSLSRVHWVGESSGGIIGLLLAAAHPERVASLVLCNTPTRIPDRIKRIYALDKATASEAMRAYGVGAWCRQTLGYRLDVARAGTDLGDWVVREMDRTPREIAAAMHDCFEEVDTVPLLPRITAPVLLLSGANSPIASAQQQTFLDALPNGRIETVAGVGHGVNLLQPECCARLATEFWRSLEERAPLSLSTPR